MSWKLIFGLSIFGLIMGIATVFVVPSSIEPLFWLVIFIICAVAIARSMAPRPFLHGFLTSIVNSVWITSAHLIFFERYVAGHAQEAQSFGASRGMMLMVGPIVGVVSGVVLGLFALLASKLLRPKAAVTGG